MEEDPFGRICVSNKTEDVNLKVFNMMNGINELKTVAKNISRECRYKSDGRKQKWDKNGTTVSVSVSVKKQYRHCSCEDYAWNPSKCACDCDKNCENGEYLKECECIKSYWWSSHYMWWDWGYFQNCSNQS